MRQNYYEILKDLEFDPPEKNIRIIEKQIEDWKQRQENLLASESKEEKRKKIKDELALYDDIREILTDQKKRNAEAKAMKEQCIAQLEQLLDILIQGENKALEVTRVQMREVARKLRLQPGTVQKVYEKKGFQIQNRNMVIKLNDYFLLSTTANEIKKKIDELRLVAIPEFAWTSKVTDLYALACFLSGGTEADVESYHKRRTTELYSIMEAWAVKKASDMSKEGHLLKDILSAGSSQIFNEEGNRRKYDNSIQKEKLKDFFVLLKKAPEIFKRDPYFANSCIRTVQKYFSDYDLALALYNNEAGLTQEPYEPMEALVYVACPSCKTSNEFRTLEDAQHGKCKTCGTDLYIKCPNCKKMVPASAYRCACGFQIFEMQFFEEYYHASEIALDVMDFAGAKKQFENAKKAYPGHEKLKKLESQIKDAEGEWVQSVNKLDNSISTGYIMKAQDMLQKLTVSMPKLNLEKQKRIISQKLDDARRKMPAANAHDMDAVNRLLSILESIKDYQLAIDHLKLIKPQTPGKVYVAVGTGAKRSHSVTWEAAKDCGVQYKVVRKTDGLPHTHMDGKTIAEDLAVLQCVDYDVEPGLSYGYAVFAYRYGVYSAPSTCEFVNCSELETDKLHASAEDGICRFSWTLPPNAIGVRIMRMEGGVPAPGQSNLTEMVAECAVAGFDDRNVKNGIMYGYRLQCVYSFGAQKRYSNQGITKTLIPDVMPVAVQRISSKVDGYHVTLKWEVTDAIDRKLVIQQISDAESGIAGQILPIWEINAHLGRGRVYYNGQTNQKQCVFDIPENSSVNLAVVVMGGTQGVVSGIVHVSSVKKCEIDRNKTRIDGRRLYIYLNTLPEHLENIHYTFEQKTGRDVPWAKKKDAQNNKLKRMAVNEYKADGMIVMEPVPQTEIYVSVIGQYRMPDGSEVYSEASKMKLANKPKLQIGYYLEWSGGGLFSRGKRTCRLCFDTQARDRPEMFLVYRVDGRVPMDAKGSKVAELLILTAKEDGFVEEKKYELGNIGSLSSGSEIRLFLSEEYSSEYELNITNIGSLKVP